MSGPDRPVPGPGGPGSAEGAGRAGSAGAEEPGNTGDAATAGAGSTGSTGSVASADGTGPARDGILERLRGRLIVSCQAYPGEPLRDPLIMRQMSLAVLEGGAAGIRAQGLDDLRAIRAVTDVPLIGLWKDGTSGVYITPTARHARDVAATGADIVAVDATFRPRPGGETLEQTVTAVHQAGRLLMADVSSYEEGIEAAALGADVVGTTLSGHVGGAPHPPGPDLDLVARLSAALSVPLVAEGRVHTPAQAQAALDAGAFAVVVGTAITHPTSLTRWFAEGMGQPGR